MKELLRAIAQDGRVDTVYMSDDNRFWAFAQAVKKVPKGVLRANFSSPLLALDPGETTGVSIWDPLHRSIYIFQLVTPEIVEGYNLVERLLQLTHFDHLRCEDYRVYGHMTEQHSFASLHTAQFIGAIRVAASRAVVPLSVCLAMHAKTFWTDEKLKMCGLYNKGLKHGRDAQRHLLRYMCE